jgi:signal peptidase I
VQTSRDTTEPAPEGDGWVRVLAMSASRSYLIVLATLGVIVLIPSLLGWNASVVQSESMAPNVSTGDVVLTTTLPETAPIPVGGVITFNVDDRSVVHRVVTVNDDNTIVTAGDANHDDDPWSITRANITGQARLLVPYVGLPGLWVQRGEYVALAAWLALTIAALVFAAPTRPVKKQKNANRGGRHARPGTTAPQVTVGAAALAGLLVLAVTATPLAPVDAAFTANTRSPAVWKAKTYPAIAVGGLAGYGVLAATSVRDTNFLFYQSRVDGAIGTTPGTTVSGFRTNDAYSVHLNDQSARSAMSSAQALRAALQERPSTRTIPGALSGTLTGGIYTSTSGAFSTGGTLTLDAKGDPSARFVFRATSSITMAQRARIVLANGAQAANVYWIAGTTATLGNLTTTSPDTVAVGNYLVTGDIALRGVLLIGRVVSFSGAVAINGEVAPTN